MPRTRRADIRIEPLRGATYHDEYKIGVYEYDEYPRSSVLAGQQRRIFLGSFLTVEDAQKEYPKADVNSFSGYRAPFLNHLPDDGDYDHFQPDE